MKGYFQDIGHLSLDTKVLWLINRVPLLMDTKTEDDISIVWSDLEEILDLTEGISISKYICANKRMNRESMEYIVKFHEKKFSSLENFKTVLVHFTFSSAIPCTYIAEMMSVIEEKAHHANILFGTFTSSDESDKIVIVSMKDR